MFTQIFVADYNTRSPTLAEVLNSQNYLQEHNCIDLSLCNLN